MSRITTTVFVVMLLLNGSASIMEASGLSEDLGVTLAPGVSETLSEADTQVRTAFDPSSGLGQTLFSLFIAGLRILEIIVNAVVATPQMFINLGFPGWLVVPLFTPMYAISTLELIYIATGRDMV